MPRPGHKLKMISVYATEEQAELLSKAAGQDNRSVSNFLLTLGIERAKELGVESVPPPKSKRKSA